MSLFISPNVLLFFFNQVLLGNAFVNCFMYKDEQGHYLTLFL